MARSLCIFYLLFLVTVILFVGNPLKYVDDPIFAAVYRTIEPGLHVGLFAVLGFLVGASRWPVHPLIQAGLLVALAASSELMQLFLAHRTARMSCFVQDIVGLVTGAVIWGLLLFACNRRRPGKQYPEVPLVLVPKPRGE